jgi:hypothetical protein
VPPSYAGKTRSHQVPNQDCNPDVVLSNKLEIQCIFERFFWVNIRSRIAIAVVLPMIINSSVSFLIVRRTLHSLSLHNGAIIGFLVVTNYLSDVLQKKAFLDAPQVNKVFNAIATLPFKCTDFVTAGLPRLLLCAVLGSFHASQDVVNHSRLFLDTALARLKDTNSSARGLAKCRRKIAKLLENPKVVSVFSPLLRRIAAGPVFHVQRFIDAFSPSHLP